MPFKKKAPAKPVKQPKVEKPQPAARRISRDFRLPPGTPVDR